MTNILVIKRFLVVTICGLLLCSCNDTKRQRELEQYLTDIKVEAAGEQKKAVISLFQLPKPVTFPPGAGPASTAAQAKNNSTDPLKNYPIKSLRFVGTLTQGEAIAAYIQTPDGMIYPVNVGDPLGTENGKIVKIDTDHVDVSVQISEPDKPPTAQIVTLQLKE